MKNIIYIILFIYAVLHFSIVFAATKEVSNESDRLYCDNKVYIDISANTFNKQVKFSCDNLNQIALDNKSINSQSNIYELSIADNNEIIQNTRNELNIIFPLDKIINFDYAKAHEYAIFFFDDKLGQWISLNSQFSNNILSAKTSHTGKFAVFLKRYDPMIDNYTFIAVLAIGVGIIFGIIYYIYELQNKL